MGKGAGEEVELVASGGELGLCAKGGEFSLGEGSEVSGVVWRGLRGGEVASKDYEGVTAGRTREISQGVRVRDGPGEESGGGLGSLGELFDRLEEEKAPDAL